MVDNEHLLQAVLSTINGAYVLILDYDGNYHRIWSDKRLDHAYGLEMEGLQGKNIAFSAPPSILEERMHIIHRVIDYGETISDEGLILCPNGIFYNDATLVPIQEPNKDIKYLLANIKEVSELRNSENATMLNILLDSSDELYYRFDLRLNEFKFISTCIQKKLGYTAKELALFTFEQFANRIHNKDINKITQILVKFNQKTIEDSFKISFRFKDKRGEYQILKHQCGVVKDEYGFPITLVGNMKVEHISSSNEFYLKNIEKYNQLSKREREILRWVAHGMTTKEIAERLFISPLTVKTHRKNIYSKLETKNMKTLIRYADAFEQE